MIAPATVASTSTKGLLLEQQPEFGPEVSSEITTRHQAKNSDEATAASTTTAITTSSPLKPHLHFRFGFYRRAIGSIEFSASTDCNDIGPVPLSLREIVKFLSNFLHQNRAALAAHLKTPQLPGIKKIQETYGVWSTSEDSLAERAYKAFKTAKVLRKQIWVVSDLPPGGLAACTRPPLFIVALESSFKEKKSVYGIFFNRKRLEQAGLIKHLSDALIDALKDVGIQSQESESLTNKGARTPRPYSRLRKAHPPRARANLRAALPTVENKVNLSYQSPLNEMCFDFPVIEEPQAALQTGVSQNILIPQPLSSADALLPCVKSFTDYSQSIGSPIKEKLPSDLPDWVRNAPANIIECYLKTKAEGGMY